MHGQISVVKWVGLPFWMTVFLWAGFAVTPIQSQDRDLVEQLNQVTGDLESKSTREKTYQLAYKMSAGESVRSRIVHLVSMDTKIEGEFENLKSRSVSTRVFRIASVDSDGNMTLVHLVESAELWQ